MKGGLYSYISSVNLSREMSASTAFWCPMDTKGNNHYWSNVNYYYNYGNSYHYNNAGGFGSYKNRWDNLASTLLKIREHTGLGGKRIASISKPSIKAMINEADIPARNGHLIDWHGGRMSNIIFVDGHVKLMQTRYDISAPGCTSWFNGTSEFEF